MADDDEIGQPCGVRNHGKDHRARWSICNLEGHDLQPVVRAFACGRHLHSVLEDMPWEMDCVQIYDLSDGERTS
ncbi:MAG TPA: hypothetical protein VHX38_03015 [Pseudonocardiaceae bacterium]|jgi:hypothetical protein|nr:hypothetical protein [Pseudonocardiaceae bacterium]